MSPRFPRLAARAGVAALVLVGLVAQGSIGRQNLSPDTANFLNQPDVDAALWIVSHTANGDVVMAGQAAIVHRVTGRRVVGFPVTSDADAIMSRIREQGVKFLVVKIGEKNPYFLPVEEERLRAVARQFPGALRLAQRGAGYEVFGVGADDADRRG
jgi:hypothetical protein